MEELLLYDIILESCNGETLASSREIAEKFDKRSHCAKLHSEKYDS